MDWSDDGPRFCCEETEKLMLPIHWRALRPSNAPPGGPYTSKGEQGTVLAKREPLRRLAGLRIRVFAKRCRRHDAAVLLAEPAAPMRAADIANVGDRRAAKLRRTRHAPARHNKLTLAVGSIANDRSHLVREDPRE